MMRGALSPLVAIAILTCGPALAADTFAFPQGCDAFLTIQGHSCLVEHYFTCEGDRPVQFIFPGEPGFLSANPKFDCGAVLSSAPALTPKEISNDHL